MVHKGGGGVKMFNNNPHGLLVARNLNILEGPQR